jgi:hypothetical protein
MKNVLFAISLTLIPVSAIADEVVVLSVEAQKSGDTWAFDVTISHGDTGWDHFADGWGVYDLDGTEYGYRILAHPHVNEQPFTRSLARVSIPANIKNVQIIPNDSVHGKGAPFIFRLP